MTTIEVLTVNKTIATFVKIEHIPCRLMTALCPD